MTQAYRMSGVLASSPFDWLSQEPWGGNTPWWEIILTIAGVFAGTFMGGKAVSAVRTRAEARREFYFGLADEVLETPTTAFACGEWVAACNRLTRVKDVLSLPERQGIDSFLEVLPYGPEGEFPKGAESLKELLEGRSYAELVRISKVACELDMPTELLKEIGQRLLVFQTRGDTELIYRRYERIMNYVGRRLRRGSPPRRLRTWTMGVGLVFEGFKRQFRRLWDRIDTLRHRRRNE